jgi:hypothetical protein
MNVVSVADIDFLTTLMGAKLSTLDCTALAAISMSEVLTYFWPLLTAAFRTLRLFWSVFLFSAKLLAK